MKILIFTLKLTLTVLSPFYLIPALCVALYVRKTQVDSNKLPRLVWGATPLINYSYWARAMKEAGYSSVTYTTGFYGTINKREDWDILMEEKFIALPAYFRPYIIFLESLLKYDIFITSCDGYFLGATPLWRFEAFLLSLACKKTIVFPYGGDSFVYKRILSQSLLHCLLMSYPGASKTQTKKAGRLDYWVKNADVFIPGFLGVNGFGRDDVRMTSVLHIDLKKWRSSMRKSSANGVQDTVYVLHAPNHRGFKGTEFIIDAVKNLQAEGLKVELLILEKMQNDEVKDIFENKIDILIEQLIYTGHGLNAIEGLASGIPVISNLEDQNITLPFRRWSFLNECPIVSASPENIQSVLRNLIVNPKLRLDLGEKGRRYAEKYHSYEAAHYVFNKIFDRVWHGKDVDLMNLYHPLLGEYPNRSPKIQHPLVNNQIID